MELTIDSVNRELQQILRENVLLVVGSGASIALDPRFGMNALSKELLGKIPSLLADDNTAAKEQWQKVSVELNNNIGLESALNGINNNKLIDIILRITGNFLAKVDKEKKAEVVNNEIEIPLEHFIRKLVDGLPGYDPVLNIITPNYDLLIEHCCDKLGISYTNGFVGGIKKRNDWKEADQQMVYIKNIPKGKKNLKVERIKKHICLLKVHGSLNWFKKGDQKFEDNTLVYEKDFDNNEIARLIITPGDKKYEKAFSETFNLFTRAAQAAASAGSFVFLGYGFNDDHIQESIKKEIIDKKKAGIIVTKELSERAETLLKKSNNVWAIYQEKQNEGNKYQNNTRIYNRTFGKPLIINKNIWEIQHFSREVLGE